MVPLLNAERKENSGCVWLLREFRTPLSGKGLRAFFLVCCGFSSRRADSTKIFTLWFPSASQFFLCFFYQENSRGNLRIKGIGNKHQFPKIPRNFGKPFFILNGIFYIYTINQIHIFMTHTQITEEEKKAKKAAYDKARREAKKLNSNIKPELVEIKVENSNEISEKFEKAFDYPVRIYKTLRLEKENSYRASAGSVLKFEKIKIENNNTVYRVRRTGRRTFYTTSNELTAPVTENV
jgi:hypothetical protein